jgi:hypothetical protein
MLNWLRSLIEATGRSGGPGKQKPAYSVAFDDAVICVRDPNGTQQQICWDDLHSVVILTNDTGPFSDDVHWVLAARDGGSKLILPIGSTGEQELLRELQRRLPGFGNNAVVRAMSSTENASFDVWSWTPPAG